MAPLVSLFTTLNSAGPECASLGFTECAISIVGSNLTLSVTHPLDPGPTLINFYNQPSLLSPTLAATASEATPGSSITAIGSAVPCRLLSRPDARMARHVVGDPDQAQIQYEGRPDDRRPVQRRPGVSLHLSGDGPHPWHDHVFEARCGDQRPGRNGARPCP